MQLKIPLLLVFQWSLSKWISEVLHIALTEFLSALHTFCGCNGELESVPANPTDPIEEPVYTDGISYWPEMNITADVTWQADKMMLYCSFLYVVQWMCTFWKAVFVCICQGAFRIRVGMIILSLHYSRDSAVRWEKNLCFSLKKWYVLYVRNDMDCCDVTYR